MATKSKIVEPSFRLGSGRYIQEAGAVSLIGQEVLRLGASRPLVLMGEHGEAIAGEAVKLSLKESGLNARFLRYDGFCNPAHCEKILAMPEAAGCDVIIGVGGGNLMDAAKLCAAIGQLPVINIPTSSATCAAFTPLSVMYNDDEQTIGTRHHLQEVNAVLADMDILCRQPTRLLVAGIYDALAKFVEIRQRLEGKKEEDVDIGLRSAFVLSDFTYERLLADLPVAFADVSAGRNSKAVYDSVYISIALTGVISSLSRGSNQCAIAHKVYETSRTLFPKTVHSYLHGELVAIGMIAQIAYNGEEEKAEPFRRQMKQFGMPTSLPELGIPADEATLMAYYDKIVNSSAMAGTPPEEQKRLLKSLRLVF